MMFMAPVSLLFLSFMFTSTLMAVASTNWLMAWIAMEVNLLAFIPIILSEKLNQEVEAAVKYFMSQALGSALMIYSSVSLWGSLSSTVLMSVLVMSLLLKLGAAPCHYWFPSVMLSMSWMNCLILATWQKIAPLVLLVFLLSSTNSLKLLISVCGGLNAILGGWMGLNQTHMRSILAYSSITHMGWMVGASLVGGIPATMYLMFYSLVITPLFIMLGMLKTTSMAQLSQLMLKSKYILMMVTVLLLSLAGLPPLTGFLPKWMVISLLSNLNITLVYPLLMGSFMNLYFYLNITFNSLTSLITPTSNPVSMSMSTTMSMVFLTGVSALGFIPIMFYAMTLLY